MHWLSKLDFEKVYFQSRQEVSTINCENEGLCRQNSYLKENEIVLKFKPHSRKIVNLAGGNNGVGLHAVWKVRVVTVTRLAPDQKGLQKIFCKSAG